MRKPPTRARKTAPRPAPAKAPDHRKSAVTREKILAAARKVFSEYPYKAASMRMIGQAGGFDHPLIHYYFPTKAGLFEAVAAEISREIYLNNIQWFGGMEHLSPSDGLPLYIDRFLDYNFKHPEAFRMISLNAPQLDKLSEIPGYQHIIEVLAQTRSSFAEKVRLRSTDQDFDRYINSFSALVIFFLGSAACQAEVLGVDPGSNEYRIWVKETLIYIFLPLLKKLILQASAAPDSPSRKS